MAIICHMLTVPWRWYITPTAYVPYPAAPILQVVLGSTQPSNIRAKPRSARTRWSAPWASNFNRMFWGFLSHSDAVAPNGWNYSTVLHDKLLTWPATWASSIPKQGPNQARNGSWWERIFGLVLIWRTCKLRWRKNTKGSLMTALFAQTYHLRPGYLKVNGFTPQTKTLHD